MKITPRSEKEVAEMNLWPVGQYGFEVLDAADKVSKKKPDGSGGNEMIELKIAVYNSDGAHRIVFDYLMDTATMAYKLRHASDACGILDKYESGMLMAEDFRGRSGNLKLAIKKGNDEFPNSSNAVSDYVVGKRVGDIDHQAPLASTKNSVSSIADDSSIPF